MLEAVFEAGVCVNAVMGNGHPIHFLNLRYCTEVWGLSST